MGSMQSRRSRAPESDVACVLRVASSSRLIVMGGRRGVVRCDGRKGVACHSSVQEVGRMDNDRGRRNDVSVSLPCQL